MKSAIRLKKKKITIFPLPGKNCVQQDAGRQPDKDVLTFLSTRLTADAVLEQQQQQQQ